MHITYRWRQSQVAFAPRALGSAPSDHYPNTSPFFRYRPNACHWFCNSHFQISDFPSLNTSRQEPASSIHQSIHPSTTRIDPYSISLVGSTTKGPCTCPDSHEISQWLEFLQIRPRDSTFATVGHITLQTEIKSTIFQCGCCSNLVLLGLF